MTTNYRIEAGSCALLIGVSAYEDPGFPPIQAANNSLTAMQQVLSDPELCGWAPGSITVASNPSSVRDLAVQITNLARETHDVLLIYYVGHGTLSNRGELSLTVTTTLSEHPKITGLPWSAVADALRESPARMRCVILDCCFAGQAIEAMTEQSDKIVADISHIKGVYTLTATTRNRTAHVPPSGQQNDERTSFTANFVDLIKSGIPDAPANLTFSAIYPHLRARLASLGLPLPNQRNTDLADKFIFSKNVAAHSRNANEAKQDPEQDTPLKHLSAEEAISLDTFAIQVFTNIANDSSENIEDRLEAAGRLARLDRASAAEAYAEIANDSSHDISERFEAAGQLVELSPKLATDVYWNMGNDGFLDLVERREAAERLGQLDAAIGAEALSAIAYDEENTSVIQLRFPGSRKTAAAVSIGLLIVTLIVIISVYM